MVIRKVVLVESSKGTTTMGVAIEKWAEEKKLESVSMSIDEEDEHQFDKLSNLELSQMLKKNLDNLARAHELMEILDIPTERSSTVGTINVLDLYDILMNPEKLKVLVSKLRNKAFW